MHEILAERLWIGHGDDLVNPRRLFSVGIQAVVDLAYEERPADLPRQLIYCRFPLNDGGGNDPQMLRLAVECVANLISQNTRTLVACFAGMSRSPCIAAAALAIHSNESPNEILQGISEWKRLDVSALFWQDVIEACGCVTQSFS